MVKHRPAGIFVGSVFVFVQVISERSELLVADWLEAGYHNTDEPYKCI